MCTSVCLCPATFCELERQQKARQKIQFCTMAAAKVFCHKFIKLKKYAALKKCYKF